MKKHGRQRTTCDVLPPHFIMRRKAHDLIGHIGILGAITGTSDSAYWATLLFGEQLTKGIQHHAQVAYTHRNLSVCHHDTYSAWLITYLDS